MIVAPFEFPSAGLSISFTLAFSQWWMPASQISLFCQEEESRKLTQRACSVWHTPLLLPLLFSALVFFSHIINSWNPDLTDRRIYIYVRECHTTYGEPLTAIKRFTTKRFFTAPITWHQPWPIMHPCLCLLSLLTQSTAISSSTSCCATSAVVMVMLTVREANGEPLYYSGTSARAHTHTQTYLRV